MLNINFEALRRIGFHQTFISQLPVDLSAPALSALERPMRLIEAHKDRYQLHDGECIYSARALPRLLTGLAEQEQPLAVGDWVIAEINPLDEWWINRRLSPVNYLSRRSYDGKRQSVASNIDTALLVMGLDHDFNMRRLERYIAMVLAADIMPVIVLSKADLTANAQLRVDEINDRLRGRYPVIALNTLDGNAITLLMPWLGAGQTLCLLGSSGAGKSSLTNTLTQAQQQTGAIRQNDSRGRHTTTARSMHFCDSGACIIDAPGLRTLRPDGDDETLHAAFDEIALWAAQCQFRNCRHELEPGCAVRTHCDPDRLFNYHKLLRDMQRLQQTPLERIAERSRWKALMKSAGLRGKQKRD